MEDRFSLRKLAAREPVVFDMEGFVEQDEEWDEEEGSTQAAAAGQATEVLEIIDLKLADLCLFSGCFKNTALRNSWFEPHAHQAVKQRI